MRYSALQSATAVVSLLCPHPTVRLPAQVGGKASPPVTSTQTQRPPAPAGPLRGNSANDNQNNCCSQRRLVQELERQLTLLRRLNAEHMREEWVRASYPSPYYPYLHNLPVHSARGMA